MIPCVSSQTSQCEPDELTTEKESCFSRPRKPLAEEVLTLHRRRRNLAVEDHLLLRELGNVISILHRLLLGLRLELRLGLRLGLRLAHFLGLLLNALDPGERGVVVARSLCFGLVLDFLLDTVLFLVVVIGKTSLAYLVTELVALDGLASGAALGGLEVFRRLLVAVESHASSMTIGDLALLGNGFPVDLGAISCQMTFKNDEGVYSGRREHDNEALGGNDKQ